jgi:Phage integrase family
MAVSGQDRLLPPDVPYGAAYSGRGLSLKSSSVDLKRSTITIEAAYAKNGRTRTVPLNSIALEALKRLKVDGEHIFVNDEGMPYRSISSIFKRACKRASLIGVTPHTFRHYICVAVGDGGSGLANGSGVGRMADPLDGRALRALLSRAQGAGGWSLLPGRHREELLDFSQVIPNHRQLLLRERRGCGRGCQKILTRSEVELNRIAERKIWLRHKSTAFLTKCRRLALPGGRRQVWCVGKTMRSAVTQRRYVVERYH